MKAVAYTCKAGFGADDASGCSCSTRLVHKKSDKPSSLHRILRFLCKSFIARTMGSAGVTCTVNRSMNTVTDLGGVSRVALFAGL